MHEQSRSNVQDLEPHDEEELTPEQAERAQGGSQGPLSPERPRGDQYHFTGPWEL